MKIFDKNIYFKEFVPPIFYRTMKFIRSKISKGSVYFHPFNYLPKDINPKWILDIGANEGGVAKAGFKTYPKCKIICFEPVASTMNLLKQNLKNHLADVILYNKAVSDFTGESVINITSTHGSNSMEKQSFLHKYMNKHVVEIAKEKISCVKLDDIYQEFPSKYIDIMKVDVEGHELKVLQGGSNFIKSYVDTIIIEIAFNRDMSILDQKYVKIIDLLTQWGFVLINIFDVHNQDNSLPYKNLMISQMDCVFRHKSKLQ